MVNIEKYYILDKPECLIQVLDICQRKLCACQLFKSLRQLLGMSIYSPNIIYGNTWTSTYSRARYIENNRKRMKLTKRLELFSCQRYT